MNYVITQSLKQNLCDVLKIRLEMTESKINELEDRSIEFTLSKQQRENNKQKKNKASETCEITIVPLKSQKERRKRIGLKKYLKK